MSRPGKRIAVLDANEISRRVRCFVIECWGYRLHPAGTAAELRRLLDATLVDAVLAALPRAKDWEALRAAQASGVPVMALTAQRLGPAGGDACANVALPFEATTMVEIRERLRLLARRKPGPKRADKCAGKCEGGLDAEKEDGCGPEV